MNENTDAGIDKTMVSSPEAEAQVQNSITQMSAGVECPVCNTSNPRSEVYCIDCGFLLGEEPAAVEETEEADAVYKLATPDGTREFVLHPGENVVGRENADVLLSHNTVSRKHAVVLVEENGVFVTDSGSTNGTMLDGTPLQAEEKTALVDGAELSFGNQVLRLIAPDTEASESDEAQGAVEEVEDSADEKQVDEAEDQSGADSPADECDHEEPAAEVVARLVSTDGAHSFDLLSGVNTLGRRAGDNTIVVPDLYCSGRHADVDIDEGQYTITDVGSTNGTLVNGEKLESGAARQLQKDDEITIGRIVFKIEDA